MASDTPRAVGKSPDSKQTVQKKTVVLRPVESKKMLPTLLSLIAFAGCIAFLVARIHRTLATPATSDIDAVTGRPQFNEARAMSIVRKMSDAEEFGYRIVGTKELVDSQVYLVNMLEQMKQDLESSELGQMHEIEIYNQTGSSAHLFDFIGKKVWKKYYNLTNIIVRVSAKDAASKANAVLVNSHVDSTLPSPGAADDCAGVVSSLEAIRVLVGTPERLHNSVVFLFNGAEESLQDASHLFIIQHPLKDTIRSVINLEAVGTAGRELLFQATNEQMIRAYSHAPRKYGSILASEIFGSGAIVSDTDFRQFVQYGNLTGLDMAFISNSYMYHTRQDIAKNLEAGSLTNMGENLIALLRQLTLPGTVLTGKADQKKTPIFFNALGPTFFFIYSPETALQMYAAMSLVLGAILLDRMRKDQKLLQWYSLLALFGSLIGAVVCSNVVAAVMDQLKPLSFFRHELLALLLYGPPAILGALSIQWLTHLNSPSNALPHDSALVEHRNFLAIAFYYSFGATALQFFGIGSAYLFAIAGGWLTICLLVNDYLLPRGPASSDRSVHLFTYFMAQISPMIVGTEGILAFTDLFIPLSGRLGADAPIDHIIGTLMAVLTFLCTPTLLPLAHRFGLRKLERWIGVMALLTVVSTVVFALPQWNSFGARQPKRVISLHMENISTTPPTFQLHVAAMDREHGFYDLVKHSTEAMGIDSTDLRYDRIEEHIPDYDILYPVSQFLTAYKVPLPQPLVTYQSPWAETFTVRATQSAINVPRKTRDVTITCKHPGIIWTVLSFDADVISWDLPEAPSRGMQRHHVKEASGYGTDEWTLQMTIQLSDAQLQAYMRESQRKKGQRGDKSDADVELGMLKVDFSGLDEQGMWPAKKKSYVAGVRPGMDLFRQFEQHLPRYVDSLLLSAVAGVTRL